MVLKKRPVSLYCVLFLFFFFSSFLEVFVNNMIDVSRVSCIVYLVFCVLHLKKIVSNVSILGDVSIVKRVSRASD